MSPAALKGDARHKVVQCLVGAPAEAEIDGEFPSAKSGAEDDYKVACYCSKIFDIGGRWPDWEAKAAGFVEEHWSEIRAVADTVLDSPATGTKRKIEGSKVYELLGAI